MSTSLIGVDDNVDAAGENIHVQKPAELRSWAQPLQPPRGKVSHHLPESRNISAAILEHHVGPNGLAEPAAGPGS
jgi:eukaryotic-like serine/threonine-protein kinase